MLLKTARQVVIGVIGGTVLLVGIAMIALPGPATLVIPAGLAILASEFVWARWLLRKVKRGMRNAAGAIFGSSSAPPRAPPPGPPDGGGAN